MQDMLIGPEAIANKKTKTVDKTTECSRGLR